MQHSKTAFKDEKVAPLVKQKKFFEKLPLVNRRECKKYRTYNGNG